jgi:hypothetical protein
MLFDDIFSLTDLILTSTSNTSNTIKSPEQDDVDRWLNSSPEIPQKISTYALETSFDNEFDDDDDELQDGDNGTDKGSPIKSLFFSGLNTTSSFIPVEDNCNKDIKQTSLLTASLKDFATKTATNGSYINDATPLVIYLPDRSPMSMIADSSITFDELIRQILSTHKQLGKLPSLEYSSPERYEIRLHDIDGEPDEGEIMGNKSIKSMGDNEFCLINKVGYRESTSKLCIEKNIITIHIQGRNLIQLDVDDATTFMDLLPRISEKCKLNLFTNEFVFSITKVDQDRLSLLPIAIDINSNVINLGIKNFELEKKIYKDEPSSHLSKRHVTSVVSEKTNEKDLYTVKSAQEREFFYVIKKNKYGAKQKRVMGIDGNYIYNFSTTNSSHGLSPRNKRLISTVKSVDPLGDKSFKITAHNPEKGEYQEIEYICDNERECILIMDKLKVLIRLKGTRL